ncbi:MAG: hypothetical protein IPO88_22410 [Nannocystis sp.]|uniref:hypothetical protein n=1 Tax=Nannocystis sp. TaxID=1962667 RepID=UPI0024233BB5|nr:hypothetical protein [Nannocystis sp.]MBK9756197.1 hypothetical protein [Nannocystis sp.]
MTDASTSAAAWQAGLRPWLVRELLRPTALARDVEAGWLGDLLGRSAWPELRLPLLASWTAQWSPDSDDEAPALPVVHARPLGPSPPTDAPGLVVQVQLQPSAPAEAAAAPPPRAALRPLRDATPTPAPPLAHAPAAVVASAPAPSAASPQPTPGPRAPTSDLAASAHAEPARPPARATTDEPSRQRPSSAELPRVVAAFQRERPGRHGQAPAPTTTGPRPAASQDPIAAIAATPATTPTSPTTPTPTTAATPATPATQRTHRPGPPRAPVQAPIDVLPLVHNTLSHTPGPSGHVAGDSSTTPPPGPARDQLPRVPDEPTPHSGRLAAAPPREPAVPAALPVAEARRPPAAPPRATPPRDLSQSTAPPAAPPRAVLRPAEPAAPVRARGLPGERAPLTAPATWSGDPPTPTRPGPPRTELPHTHAAATRPDEPRRAPPTIASSPVRTDIQPATPVSAPAQPPAPALDIEALIDTVQRRLARELGRARELRRAIR